MYFDISRFTMNKYDTIPEFNVDCKADVVSLI